MKKIVLLLTAVVVIANVGVAQTKKIASTTVKTLQGQNFSTADISNDGKPVIINFWATWCGPCKKELNTIAELYEDWQAETGVKLVAISIDDSRNMNKVAPYVASKDWQYDVYIDPNSDFKRAMNVNNPPHTFLLDGNGNVVWQHNGYAAGDEEELIQEVRKLVKK